MYECLEAEQSLISCLIQRQDSIEEIMDMVSPEYFEHGVLGAIYYEYRKAFDEHKEITLVELKQNLSTQFTDEEVGEAIMHCVTSQALSYQIRNFAEVIARHYKKTTVEAIFTRTELQDATIERQIDTLIGDLETLQGGEVSEGFTIADIAKQYKDKYFNGEKKDILYIGEDAIDDLTGGFQGGDIVCMCGRPSTGKSALAFQWVQEFAKQGKKVGYYNLEMQMPSVFERLVAGRTGIEIVRLRKATTFLNDEKSKYEYAIEQLERENNIMIFTGAKTVADIRRDQRKFRFDLIAVDYLQLLIPSTRYQGNRAAEVAQISRDLKDIAMTYNIPVLALSQLNRLSEGRKDKEPMMSDIRESGAIEQDASIIFMIWNSDEEDRSKKGFKTEKSRSGKCGKLDMVFDGAHLRFELEDNVSPFGA